jgi:hypothetical protein
MAKRVRRDARRSGSDIRVNEEALRYFGMPDTQLAIAALLDEPLYPPVRDDNS